MVASKRDAIAAIIEMNPTANPVFLSEFSKGELEQYLDRLGRAIEAACPDDRFTGRLPASPTSSPYDDPGDSARFDDGQW